MRAPWVFSAIVVLSSVLAGCMDGDDPVKPAASLDEAETGNLTKGPPPSVEGYVLAEDRSFLAGAKVTVQNRNMTTVTDAAGRYAFWDLADNEIYILLAELEGYRTKPLQIVAVKDKVIRLDFVLEEKPTDEPRIEFQDRNGLISCQIHAGFGGDHGGNGTDESFMCSGLGGQDPNAVQVLEFSLAPGTIGLVIEVKWDATNPPIGEFLKAKAETVGYGDLDTEFGEVIGPSILKIEVAQDSVKRYYTGNGGLLRVSVDAHIEDDDEQAAGAAMAIQQSFTVGVSTFFVEPNPPSYSAYSGG